DDADDFPRGLGKFRPHASADGDALSHRVFVRPVLLCQSFVDHHDALCRSVIVIGEQPSAKQWNMKRFKIVRRDRTPARAGRILSVARSASFNLEGKSQTAFKRKAAGG